MTAPPTRSRSCAPGIGNEVAPPPPTTKSQSRRVKRGAMDITRRPSVTSVFSVVIPSDLARSHTPGHRQERDPAAPHKKNSRSRRPPPPSPRFNHREHGGRRGSTAPTTGSRSRTAGIGRRGAPPPPTKKTSGSRRARRGAAGIMRRPSVTSVFSVVIPSRLTRSRAPGHRQDGPSPGAALHSFPEGEEFPTPVRIPFRDPGMGGQGEKPGGQIP